jgi:hypothetical protein
MSSYATDNPQTMSGIGGAHDYSQYYLPQNMGIDSPPPDAPVDSQYLTDEAGLRADITGQYQDELGFLGYTDAQGNYIPGSLLTDAQINEAQYEQQRQQAILQNTQTAQQQGTLFSGQRAVQQAQAEAPYLSSIAGIEQKLPVDLAGHFEKAAGLISSYQNQQSALLAAAAARAAALTSANPPADTTPPATTTPPTSTPPPTGTTTTPPPPDNTFEGIPTGDNGAYRWGTQPFVAMAGGGEVDGATPALIGEQGPEAVVPRRALTPDENDQLTQLRQAAQLRMSGGSPMRRNDVPGIHWFGPGGSGVAYPPENPPPSGIIEGLPPMGVRPPGWTPAHELYMQGHHAAALDQYMAHHTAAMAGRAVQPDWVRHAVASRLRTHPTPVPVPPVMVPTHGVLPPGLSPAAGAAY